MTYYPTISALQSLLHEVKSRHQNIGFVPTMGALHSGHLSLVERSVAENQLTVVSIFVNPTQFNNATDFKTYPRHIEEDLALLADFGKKIAIYIPEVNDIYPQEVASQPFDFGGIELQMEGQFRPGHFDGVGTVVKRFFELIQPDNAYFGEKDFQQLQVIRKLVEIEKLPVNIIGCPISRAASGLALSSRNKRLNPSQLRESPLIYQVLKQARQDFGTKSVKNITHAVTEAFKSNPELKLEYFTIADEVTLKPVQRKIKNKKYRAFIAVFAGEVRLIDNIALY